MQDPIFDKAEYLRPLPEKLFFKKSTGPPIPRQVKIRSKRPWENWLYGVVRDVGMGGVGTIKVYRDGHLVGTARVADWAEADRLFEATVDAATEATQEVEANL